MAGEIQVRRSPSPCVEEWFDEMEEEELALAEQRRVDVAEGPRYIGAIDFKEVVLPTRHGDQRRRVYCHQVALPRESRFTCPHFDDLEYWGDFNPLSVEQRLNRNLQDADGVKANGFNEAFQGYTDWLLGRAEEPDQREKGAISFGCKAFNRQMEVQFHSSTQLVSGTASHIGGVRRTMEDAEVAGIICAYTPSGEGALPKTFAYSAVFDGHAHGHECASLAAGFHHQYLCSRLAELDHLGPVVGRSYPLMVSTVDLSRSLTCEGGSTANVCIDIDNEVWCGNLGDTRAFLVTLRGEVIQISEDQKPSHIIIEEAGKETKIVPDKFSRGVLKRGRSVIGQRVDGVLAVARALGNGQFTSSRSKAVRITRARVEQELGRPLEPGEVVYLCQGCDGLFDVASTLQVGRLVARRLAQGYSCARVSADVVRGALEAKSTDNVTVLVRETVLRGEPVT